MNLVMDIILPSVLAVLLLAWGIGFHISCVRDPCWPKWSGDQRALLTGAMLVFVGYGVGIIGTQIFIHYQQPDSILGGLNALFWPIYWIGVASGGVVLPQGA